MEVPSDILLIDKPKGITSFDVIRKLRKQFRVIQERHTRTPISLLPKSESVRIDNTLVAIPEPDMVFESYIARNPSTKKLVCGHALKPKLGHAGTLDPLASGLLLIGVGEGTKKLSSLLKLSKVYVADILLGIRTTTGDLEGEIIEEKEVSELGEKQVTTVLNSMVGVHTFPVPLYSAIKKNGKPLYKYAREGKEVEVPIKEMEIKRVKLFDISNSLEEKQCVIGVEMEVSSGTYIRSVAEEIGRRLGCPATLSDLRRTRIGDFDIKDAQKV